MEDISSQQKTECQKQSSTVIMKPSSPALREQITSQLLEYVLFGSNPVEMVSVHQTGTKSKFGSPVDGTCQQDQAESKNVVTRKESEGKDVTKEIGNRQSVNASLSYAVTSFPDEVTLCVSSVPGTVFGVCAKQHIPVGTWIGPYEGKRVNLDDITANMNTSHMWEIYENSKLVSFLDGSDKNTSSWMRFIRCARHKQEQNLFAFQHDKNIFYRAFRDIPRGCELLVWYEDSYTKHMGIPLGIKNRASPHHLSEKTSSVRRPIAVHASLRVSESSGEQNLLVGAESGTDPSWEQKRKSSPHSFLSQEASVGSLTPTTQRHVKKIRTQQEISNNNNNSLAYNEPVLQLSRAGPEQTKKPVTSKHEGTRDRKMLDEVVESIGESGEFKCGQCKTTFTQRSLLNSHLCSRMPCKPYRCGHCQEAFAQPKELRMHAVVHVSEKPFKCGYCLRAFSGATTLNNHVRTHTGEKPFLCERCGKSFSQAFQLSRHRRLCVQHTD